MGGTELTGSTWRTWAWRLRYRLSAITASSTPPEFSGGHLEPNRTPPGFTPYHRSNWSVCICVDERHANFALTDFIMRPSQFSFSIYSLSSNLIPSPLTFSNSLSFVTHFTEQPYFQNIVYIIIFNVLLVRCALLLCDGAIEALLLLAVLHLSRAELHPHQPYHVTSPNDDQTI